MDLARRCGDITTWRTGNRGRQTNGGARCGATEAEAGAIF